MTDLAISEATEAIETLLESGEGIPSQQKNEVAQTSYQYPGPNSGFKRLEEENSITKIQQLEAIDKKAEDEINRLKLAQNQLLILEELSIEYELTLPGELEDRSELEQQQ